MGMKGDVCPCGVLINFVAIEAGTEKYHTCKPKVAYGEATLPVPTAQSEGFRDPRQPDRQEGADRSTSFGKTEGKAECAGRKDDSGKLRYSLLPTTAVRQIVKVLMWGANHYAPENWRFVADWRSRYYDAALRHLHDWHEGQTFDPQTKLRTLAHAGCCILFLLALDMGKDRD